MNRKLKTTQLDRLSPDQFKSTAKHPIIFVLDNVRSAHNVGSFFRTCDALGLDELWLVGITPVPPHKEIRKTALGATQTVTWKYFENATLALEAAKSAGYFVISAEQAQETVALHAWQWPQSGQPVAVIFGNEVDGVDQKLIDASDQVVEIPQFGTKHSFNVGVTGGIIGWELVVKYYATQS